MPVTFTYTPPKRNAGLLVHEAANAAEDAIAAALLDASQPLVPYEEGVLKASGRTGRDALGAFVTYGRDDDGDGKHAPSNQYVLKQHEDKELHHPNGGQSDFLRTPMYAAHEAMLAAGAVEMKVAFE